MSALPDRPPTVSIVNDYEIIVRGLAAMLEPYTERIRIVELDAGREPEVNADVALFDTFAGRRHSLERAEKMVLGQTVRHVVLYTWDAPWEFLEDASRIGVVGGRPEVARCGRRSSTPSSASRVASGWVSTA